MPRNMTIRWNHTDPDSLQKFELRTGPATINESPVGVHFHRVVIPGREPESNTDLFAVLEAGGSFSVKARIPVDPDHNQATVDAVNADGKIRTRIAPITIELPPPPAPPAEPVTLISAVAVDE